MIRSYAVCSNKTEKKGLYHFKNDIIVKNKLNQGKSFNNFLFEKKQAYIQEGKVWLNNIRGKKDNRESISDLARPLKLWNFTSMDMIVSTF